jgi:hypothetical protein
VVTLWSPDGTRSIPGIPAHIDTAADRSVVPLQLLRQLGLQPSPRPLVVHGPGTTPQRLDVDAVDIETPVVAIVSTRVVTHPNEHFLLLGREILNLFRITIDGPNQSVEFH